MHGSLTLLVVEDGKLAVVVVVSMVVVVAPQLQDGTVVGNLIVVRTAEAV